MKEDLLCPVGPWSAADRRTPNSNCSSRIRADDDAEADVEVAQGRLDVVAQGRTAVDRVLVPGAAAHHPPRLALRTPGVLHFLGGVSPLPVAAPLPDVAVHVKQAPRVGRERADRGREGV